MSHCETTHQQSPNVPATPKKEQEKLSELDEQALTLVTGGALDIRSNGGGKGSGGGG